MKAMILAAGLGTRLQPLTNEKPKALVEIEGKPLLEIMINKLIAFGCSEIIVNVHHFAGQIIEFLKIKKDFNIRIEVSDESELLLDTGGGIKKARWFFDDGRDFPVINVDVLTDLDLKAMMFYHQEKNALATVAVRNRPTNRYFLFDDGMRLCGWMNNNSGEKIVARDEGDRLSPLAFSGIHVVNPQIFNLIKFEGRFSIVDLYLDLAKHFDIFGYRHDHGYWVDVGKGSAVSSRLSTTQQFNNSTTQQ